MAAQCIRCGGSPYREYAFDCEHDDGAAPEPNVHAHFAWKGHGQELFYVAHGKMPLRSCEWFDLIVDHPTRDGAIALWKERYVWGRAVQGIFLTLTRWAEEGAPGRCAFVELDEVSKFIDSKIGRASDAAIERASEWVRPLAAALKDTRRFGEDEERVPEVGDIACYPGQPRDGRRIDRARDGLAWSGATVWCYDDLRWTGAHWEIRS